MKNFYLLATFLITGYSYGQTINGFAANPSFEDGSAAAMVKDVALDDWKLGGPYSDDARVSASIQSTNVHAGDGSKAAEVTSVNIDNKEWGIRLINTTHPFDGDNKNPIEVTVSFWAKTTDEAPASANVSGDMRLLVKDTGPLGQATTNGQLDKTHRVILTTDTWVNITKTFTFPAAASYSLSLFFEFGKVDGVTQIDGITTSVTGGATLATQDIAKEDSSVFIYPNPATNVLNYTAEGILNTEVYNLVGQKLKVEKDVGSVNTSTFSKGSYILKLTRENGVVSTKRFIKE